MSSAIIPIPKIDVSVRVATLADVPFMDALQKRNGKALGHFTWKQFEEYVEMGSVLVAEADVKREYVKREEASPHVFTSSRFMGYIIHRDRYLKRDELGVIFQLCVTQGEQRKLVGATLVREAFARSAYGCRLYCLWCAQDLEANHFWESLGFVPIAFRAGSANKRRVHIFWQKRIVEGDSQSQWWYPFQTAGGALRADRVVFPIPAGVRWQDVEAVRLPTEDVARASRPCLPGRRKKDTGETPVLRNMPRPMGGFRFQSEIEAELPAKTPRGKKPKATPAKIDPKHLRAARELRDRWMEHVNAGGLQLESDGKYDVARQRRLRVTASDAVPHLAPKQLPPLAA